MGKQDLINKIKAKAEKADAEKAAATVVSQPGKAAPAASAEATGAENLWISRSRPVENPRLRLFTFHYAGGSRAIYADWWKDLPEDVEICAVQFPGRENRMTEQPYRDFYPLVQALSKAAAPFLDKPFAFFGHCMGALTSFELVRHLRRQNMPLPRQMFVSSFIGPQIKDPKSDILRISAEQIDGFFEILGGTPDEILENLGLMSMNRPVLQADVDLLSGYQYIDEEPLDIPISVFGSTNDKLVYMDEMERWNQQTTEKFEIRFFPGDHFYLFSHRPWLMKSLKDRLLAINA